MKINSVHFIFSLVILLSSCNNSKNQEYFSSVNIISAENAPTIPDFSLKDLQGNLRSSLDYRGKFLVIHIATTWCPFCNAEAPYLEKLHRDYRDKNVEVLIIDVREDRDLVYNKLAKRFNLSFPILLDQDGTIAAELAPEDVLPDLARDEVMLASNLIINPEGEILYMSLLDSQNFDAELTHLRLTLDDLVAAHSMRLPNLNSFYLRAEDLGILRRGQEAMIYASLQIPSGLYIHSFDSLHPNLIPLKVNVESPCGFEIGAPKYPPYELIHLQGSDIPNRVYKNRVKVEIPLYIDGEVSGNHQIIAHFSYQACDRTHCFYPVTQSIEIPVDII